jgi:hypothetical protein
MIASCDISLTATVQATETPWSSFQMPSSTLIFTARRLAEGLITLCVDLFENVNLHRLVGHQTLEPRVLLFQCS